MPEPVTRWKAKNGSVHDTFEDAIACDLATVLGKIGNGDNSLTPAIARKIIEQGDEIAELLAALEKHNLTESGPVLCPPAQILNASEGPAPLRASASPREPLHEAA